MMTWIDHADIRTMNPAMPRAEAAIANGERFVFVGCSAAAKAYLGGQPYDYIDAKGATAIPGFHDAHLHFAHTAMRARNADLTGARSIAEVQAALRGHIERADGPWVIAEGWNQERFAERRLLTRQDLDAVSRDRPIVASRACGHILAANSEALRLAQVDSADGILRENEQEAIWKHVPDAEPDQVMQAMLALQQAFFAKGITAVQSDDLGGAPTDECWAFLTRMADASASGALRLRYTEQALVESPEALRAFLAAGLHRIHSGSFQVGYIKILADGSLGARTAWLSRPYADDAGTTGMLLYAQEALDEMVALASAEGIPVAIHAIGDAAMAQALVAIERHGKGLRHAIVHAQITQASQVARCGALGLSILAQPIFLTEDAPIVRARVGDSLAGTSYAWRSMQGGGATVALSTDCPVEPFDPMPNLYCAITRRGIGLAEAYRPEEAFPLDDALYAYTAAGAEVVSLGRQMGRIQPGYLADFVLLDGRLDAAAPDLLLRTGVGSTYIGGEAVYSA